MVGPSDQSRELHPHHAEEALHQFPSTGKDWKQKQLFYLFNIFYNEPDFLKYLHCCISSILTFDYLSHCSCSAGLTSGMGWRWLTSGPWRRRPRGNLTRNEPRGRSGARQPWKSEASGTWWELWCDNIVFCFKCDLYASEMNYVM